MPATANTSLADNDLTPGTTYLYKVRAIGASGPPSDFTGINVATTIMDVDTALAGVTLKAEDVLRLRAAVNALRAAANLSPATFTDSSLAGVAVKRIHLLELRAAVDQARVALGLSALAYTDPVITPGVTIVKEAHWMEVRAATQ